MWGQLTDTRESKLVEQAIADTEREIADSAWDFDDAQYERDGNIDLVDEMSQVSGWDGGHVSDEELFREQTGEIPIGMAGVWPTAEENEAAAELQALREENAALRGQLPGPEPADLFADPDGWTEQALQKLTGNLPFDHGRPLPGKPDPFADPAGYENWILAEASRRNDVSAYHTNRINSSVQNAIQIHGEEAFGEAWNDIVSMDPRDPRAREAVRTIVTSPDPGRAVLAVRDVIRTAQQHGPHFAPMMRSQARRQRAEPWGRRAPTSYEEAVENDIADSAWD